MFIWGQPQNPTLVETANQQLLRKRHLRQIFDLVLDHGILSRAAIADRLQLSAPAVSSLVDELLEIGVLTLKGPGASSTAGRKPMLLQVNKDYRQIVTFRVNVEQIDYVLYDMCCTPIESKSVRFADDAYARHMFEMLSASGHADAAKIDAVCVSLSAIADSSSQRLLLNVLHMDDDAQFLQEVSAFYPDALLLVCNDSATFAYAENQFAAEDRTDNLIYINYSYGVGAGIIIGGTVFNGAGGCPGEIGHMSIDMNGPHCSCGNKGCLERMIGIAAILRTVRDKLQSGSFSVLKEWCNGNPKDVDLRMVTRAYEQKDRMVREVMEDIAKMLSVGLKNIISIFNPQEIVLGGDIHRFGRDFLDVILKYTRIGLWNPAASVGIRYTRIGDQGSNLGLAKYYLDNIISF